MCYRCIFFSRPNFGELVNLNIRMIFEELEGYPNSSHLRTSCMGSSRASILSPSLILLSSGTILDTYRWTFSRSGVSSYGKIKRVMHPQPRVEVTSQITSRASLCPCAWRHFRRRPRYGLPPSQILWCDSPERGQAWCLLIVAISSLILEACYLLWDIEFGLFLPFPILVTEECKQQQAIESFRGCLHYT